MLFVWILSFQDQTETSAIRIDQDIDVIIISYKKEGKWLFAYAHKHI